jgi:hypothetical protein
MAKRTRLEQLDFYRLAFNPTLTAFVEYTRSGNQINTVTYWTDNSKTQKILEQSFVRSGGIVTEIETDQYDENGTLKETFSETFTRTGGQITSQDNTLV